MKIYIKWRKVFKRSIVLIFIITLVSASFGSIPASDQILEQLDQQNDQGNGQLKTEMSQSIYGSENGLDGLFGAKNTDSSNSNNGQVDPEVQIGITYQNPYITDNTELLSVHYEQNIKMLEDGRADTDLKINIPPSVYAEQYKEMLGVSSDDLENGNPSEFIIPEKPTELKNGAVSAGRDAYFHSISVEQWYLLGVYSEISTSEVKLNDRNDGEVVVDMNGNAYPTLFKGTSGNDEFNKVLFGPSATDSMDNVTEYISSLVGYTKLMLDYFPDNQAFQRTWDTEISFPDDSIILNEEELKDRQWILYFGGGTYFISNLTQIDYNTLLLREKFFVTEFENVEPMPIGQYKSFDVQYIIPGEKNDTSPLNNTDDLDEHPFGSGVKWDFKVFDYDYNDSYTYTAIGGKVEVIFDYWMNAEVRVHVDTGKAFVEADANAGVDITATFDATYDLNKNVTLWDSGPKIFNIQVGPVPVIIVCKLSVVFKFTLEVKVVATFVTGFSTHADLKAGAEYSFWSGFKTIWEKSFTTNFIEPAWEIELSVYIHPRVEFPIEALIYSVIGPVVTPGVHVEGKLWTVIDSDTGEWTNPLWYVEAYVNVLVGVKVGIPYLYENQWDWEIARWVFLTFGNVDPSNQDTIPPTSQIDAMSPPYVYLGGDVNDDQNWVHGRNNYIWLYAEDEAQEGSIPEGLESIYVMFTDANGDSEPAEYTYPSIWNITVTNPDPIYGYYDVTYWSEDNAGNKEDNNSKRFWVETYPPESWIVDQENLPEQLRAYATPVSLRASDSHVGIPDTGSQIFYQIWYEGTWSSWKSVDLNTDANVFFYTEGEHKLRWYAMDEVWNKEGNHTEIFDVLAPQAGGHYTFSNVFSSDCTEIDDGTVDIAFEMPEPKVCHRLLGLYNVTHDNKSIPQEAQIQVFVDPDSLWGTLESINFDPGDSTTKATDNSIPLDQISKFRLHVSDDAINSNFTSGFIYYADDGDVFIDPHSGYTCSEMIDSCEGVPKTTFSIGETFYAVFRLTSQGETHNFLGNHIKLRAWFDGSMYDSTEYLIDQSGYSVCLPWTIQVNMEGSGYVELMWKTDPSDAYQTLGKTDTFHITEYGYSSELIVGTPQYPPDTGPFVKTTTSFDFPQTESERYRYTIKSPFGGYVEETWQDYTGTFYLPRECSNLIEYTKDEYDFVVTNETSGEGEWVFNSSTDYSDTFYADDTAPTSSIAIGNPYYTDYNTKWIMPDTPITLTATDGPCCEQGCFPVGVKEIRYDYGEGWKTASGDTFTFKYNPNLMDHYWGDQTIKWYAVDYLGNDESETIIHEEHVKVVIPLSMASNEWFLDGAHQDNNNYVFGQGPYTNGLTSENLNWQLNVDKDEPYYGLSAPNAFVDFFYDNQGMDWSQVESIDLRIMPVSSHSGEAEVTMRIDNPMNAWKHDISTMSTRTGQYTATVNRNSWNTVTWNLGSFPRNDLKSFRLHMVQNNDYAYDGETLSFYIKDIMVAGPIGLDSGIKNHPLKDITANNQDFTVTTTDGDWCFEHYISNPVNIQHAVNWAKEGLTITVEDGTYDENVYMFRDDVTLQNGSNPIIDGQNLGPTVSLMANHLTVDGFDIINGLYGIYAPSTSGHDIKNCNIHDNTDDGIYLSNSNNHQINNCGIYQNDNDGIHTETVSNLIMQTLDVNNNGKDGMYLFSSSNIDIDNSNIYQNTDDGVDAPSTSDTDFDTCMIHDNGDDGVYMDNSQTHVFTSTDMYLNGNDGLHGETISDVTIQQSSIYSNAVDGAFFSDSSNIEFTNVSVYLNQDDGVHTDTSTVITMNDCQVYDHPDNGIYAYGSQTFNVLNSDIYQNSNNGIYMDESSVFTLDTCTVHENTNNGIYLYDSSNNNFLDSYIYSNNANGLRGEQVSDTTGSNCEFYYNTLNGIYLTNSTNIDFDTMDVYENDEFGCKLVDTSLFSLADSNVNNNAYTGGYLKNCVDTTFTNTNVYSNQNDGLYGETLTRTMIDTCDIHNNLGNGVFFYDSIDGTIKNSMITNNKINMFEGIDYLPLDTILLNNSIYLFDLGGIGIQLRSLDQTFTGNLIENNDILSNERQGIYLGGTLNHIAHHNQITDNTIRDNGVDEYSHGIFLSRTDNNTISDNVIYNHDDPDYNGTGIYLFESNLNNILYNRIYNNDEQIRLADAENRAPQTNFINHNFFSSDNSYSQDNNFSYQKGVVNYYKDMIVDARYNWWGMPNGPSGFYGPGEQDAVTHRPADGLGMRAIGDIHFDPWTGVDSIPMPETFVQLEDFTVHFSASECFAYYHNGTSHDFDVIWDFGDGTTSNEKEVDHTYDEVGTYIVNLSVVSMDTMFNPSSLADKTTIYIKVIPPGAQIAGNISTDATQGLYVRQLAYFIADIDGGKPPYNYTWDFGDGTSNPHGQWVWHYFNEPGNYVVNLTIVDMMEEQINREILVPVTVPPFEVDTGGPYPYNVGDPLRFNATTINGTSPFLFWWEFEDNVIDPVFGQHPHLVFKQNRDGSYITHLTGRDALMNHATDSTIVTPGSYEGNISINQSMFNRGFPIRHAIDGDWAGAQSFTMDEDEVLSRVELLVRKFGTPEFDLTIELREGSIDGTLLDTITLTPNDVVSTWCWMSVDFDDVPLTSGTDYFIVIPPAPSGVTTSFGYEWGYCFGDQYPDGSFWFTRDGGTLWRDLPTMYEFAFRTYGY